MAFNYDEYLRVDKMPTLWCWGCGDGVILKAIVRAIDKLGWNMDDAVSCRDDFPENPADGLRLRNRLQPYFQDIHQQEWLPSWQ